MNRQFFLAVAVCVVMSVSAFAQASAGTGTISGVVIDPSGAVVPQVEVTVRNVGTNVGRTVTTNEVGRYEVVALQPGSYELRASKSSFAVSSGPGNT